MIVRLNDIPYDIVEGTTLNTFIGSLDIQHQGIAIAIGYEVIPKSQWDETLLKDNMELMMFHAVSGG
jgi:thiamine biosynthesis protein ThiS